MSLYICSLNSGSNGNCYYVGNDHEAVLIDAGISCRETERRMSRAGLNIKKVKAVFISHEHSDHIKGVEVISKKHKLPVYITEGTLKNSGLSIAKEFRRTFTAHVPVTVGNISVEAFPKFHDASEPHSFTVSGSGVRVGVFTDIGESCVNLVEHFKSCHAAFLESNYDEEMLENGNYPFYLKKRISGNMGHLSNRQALQLFLLHRSSSLSHLVLSHLSRENNSPQLVQKLFAEHAGDTHVTVASRDYESNVFHVTGNQITDAPPVGRAAQMSLF